MPQRPVQAAVVQHENKQVNGHNIEVVCCQTAVRVPSERCVCMHVLTPCMMGRSLPAACHIRGIGAAVDGD
jgi:hypothetical protein